MTTRRAAMMMLTLALASWGCRDERGDSALASEPTALDQSNDASDLTLVAQVRRKLVVDERLSLRAKNVIVIVRAGVVTLRGDVAGAADHDALVARVASVPGIVSIDDRIAYR
jgi:osmotically-inducible protein OsmY